MPTARSCFAFSPFKFHLYVVFLLAILATEANAQEISQVYFNQQNGLGISEPKDLFLDADEVLWIAGNDAIVSYDGHTFSTILQLGENQEILKIAGHFDFWLVQTIDQLILLHTILGKSVQELPFKELIDSYVFRDNCFISTDRGIFRFELDKQRVKFTFLGNPDFALHFAEVNDRLYIIGQDALYELSSNNIRRSFGFDGILKCFSALETALDLVIGEKIIRWNKDTSYVLLEDYNVQSIVSWENLMLFDAESGEFHLEIEEDRRKIHSFDSKLLDKVQDQISISHVKYLIAEANLVRLNLDYSSREINARPKTEVFQSNGKQFYLSTNDDQVSLSDVTGYILYTGKANIIDIISTAEGDYLITENKGLIFISETESSVIIPDSISIFAVHDMKRRDEFHISSSQGLFAINRDHASIKPLLTRDSDIKEFDIDSKTPWLLLGSSKIEFLRPDLTKESTVALPLDYKKIIPSQGLPYLWEGDEIYEISTNGNKKSVYESDKIIELIRVNEEIWIIEEKRLIQLSSEGPLVYRLKELTSVDWQDFQALAHRQKLDFIDRNSILSIDIPTLIRSTQGNRPQIYLKSLEIDGNPISLNSSRVIEIPLNAFTLELDLGMASLVNPTKNEIKCRQSGVKKIPNGKYILDLTTWAGGDLEFYLDGYDQNYFTLKTYRKTVVTQFRYDLLIIGFISLILAIVGIVFFKQRARNNKGNALKASEQKKRLLELEQKALQLQLNPHFIFNSLESLRSSIAQGNTEEFDTHIAHFSSLMRKVLNASRAEFVTLDEEVSLITEYLELETAVRNQSFSFQIAGEILEEAELIEIPSMIIQPFIENSIIHGITPLKAGTGKIIIEFSELDGKICCTIKDNGIGRKASEELKDDSVIKHKSQGIDIIRNRLKQLDPNPRTIPIRYSDILDSDGNIAGTRVDLQIPQRNV